MKRFTILLAACAAFGLVSACGGGGGSGGRPDPSGPGSDGDFTTSVTLTPVQPAASTEFVATLGYVISPETVLLGAYRVVVRFDPALVAFVRLDPAIAGERIPNVDDAATGRIVVAGASADGFADGVLVKGTFRALAAGVTPANFQLTVNEAVDTRLRNLLD
jgi:hypothetical protein